MENATPPVTPTASASPAIDKDARMWAMFGHLASLAGFLIPMVGNIVGPLIIWAMKKDENEFVADQAKEAMNFQITITIGYIICFILVFILIGFFLLPVLALVSLIFTIIAAIKANDGVRYRYPFAIRLVK